MPSHGHQFAELVKVLSEKTGQPAFRNPPHELKRDIDSEGLDARDYDALLQAVVYSRHRNLPGRSVRLLVPRKKLGAKVVRQIVACLSRTTSNHLRLSLVRYLNACLDARNVLSLSGVDCLRSAYGVLFHYLTQDKCQKEIARLLYRLTREVDVTPLRARELSRILSRIGSKASNVMALAEVYDSFKPNLIVFPPRENGLPGSSGLSLLSKIKMHSKVLRIREREWVDVLKRNCVEDEDDEEENRKFIHERAFPTKRPRLFVIPEANVLLSDYFQISSMLEEQNPREDLPKDIEKALFAHLLTWDGITMQDDTLEALSRIGFPSGGDVELFEGSALIPVLELFQTCSSTFKLRLVRSLGRLFGKWIVTEPRGSTAAPLITKSIRMVDDSLCAALVLDRDDPLIQIAAAEFYTIIGKCLLKRSTKSVRIVAPPPSRELVERLLLGPSALGASLAGETMNGLISVFKMEAAINSGEQDSVRVVSAFDELARDCVKVIALGFFHEGLDDIIKSGVRNERDVLHDCDLDIKGDELGILKSFGFALFWRQWYEDRGLDPNEKPSDDVVAAYLIYLNKFAPGMVSLVSALANNFSKVAASVRLSNAQLMDDDEEEEVDEEEEE